uniref:THAP-type domain-containing protein n=1 Tax=Steinernema glaseri TaxID=37863 RepID=A0A1I7YZZ4_9BILA
MRPIHVESCRESQVQQAKRSRKQVKDRREGNADYRKVLPDAMRRCYWISSDNSISTLQESNLNYYYPSEKQPNS